MGRKGTWDFSFSVLLHRQKTAVQPRVPYYITSRHREEVDGSKEIDCDRLLNWGDSQFQWKLHFAKKIEVVSLTREFSQ